MLKHPIELIKHRNFYFHNTLSPVKKDMAVSTDYTDTNTSNLQYKQR